MDFAQKMALLAILRSHKKTKKQNIKNLTDQTFLNIIRNIYTKNWTNRTNIEEEDATLLRSWGTRFFGSLVEKKVLFTPKSTHYLTIDFFKNHNQ